MLAGAAQTAQTGLLPEPPTVFTWVRWDNTTGARCWRIDSDLKHPPTVRLYEADSGKSITNNQSLKERGWFADDEKFLTTPSKEGGQILRIEVTGLPAGRHDVYARFFSRPRKPGENWWYEAEVNLGTGEGNNPPSAYMRTHLTGYPNPVNGVRLIGGKGGYDPDTLYEIKLGTIGTETEPATTASLWVRRMQWSEFAKFGDIRIETAPNIHYSRTREDTPENRRMRECFARNATGSFGWKTVSGMVKVRPKSFDGLSGQALGDSIDLTAARGEYESRQILLYSDRQDLTVTWELSDLVSAVGDTIPVADQFLAPVGFVRINSFDQDVNGYWPDPILDYLHQCRVQRYDLQPLWYRVHVSPRTGPGLYQGQVTLMDDHGQKATVPVSVRVRKFTLPPMSRLPFAAGHKVELWDFDLEYKINPSSIYGFREEWIKEFPKWKAAGVTAINLGYIWQETFDEREPTDAQIEEQVQCIRKRYDAARAAGLGEVCYLYIFDECQAKWQPTMRRVAKSLKQAMPDLPLATTAHMPWTGEGTVEEIDIWIPLTNLYDLTKADAARQAGKKIWAYVCNSPVRPFANLFVADSSGMDTRMLVGFQAGAFRYDGFLYYNLQRGWHSPEEKAIQKTSDDPFTDGTGYTEDGPAGCGQLYQYTLKEATPDSPSVFSPLSSVRYENMRDGFEDFDYMALAREKLAKLPASDPPAQKIGPLLAPGSDFIRSMRDFSRQPAELEQVRCLLGDFLETTSADR